MKHAINDIHNPVFHSRVILCTCKPAYAHMYSDIEYKLDNTLYFTLLTVNIRLCLHYKTLLTMLEQ